MGFRYRKSRRSTPGVRLNLTGRGLNSVSIGRLGTTLNMGRTGTRLTLGIPGSGLSYSTRSSATPALLFGVIIAFFFWLISHAARGNRLAQIVLLAIVVIGWGIVTHSPSSTPSTARTAASRPPITMPIAETTSARTPLPESMRKPDVAISPEQIQPIAAAPIEPSATTETRVNVRRE